MDNVEIAQLIEKTHSPHEESEPLYREYLELSELTSIPGSMHLDQVTRLSPIAPIGMTFQVS